MSVDIKAIGYRFRVSGKTLSFDIVSTTELGIEESNKIISDFFNNFKIIKSDRIIAVGEDNGGRGEDNSGKVVDNNRKVKPARKKRNLLKDIWGSIRELLDDEFTMKEYVEALRSAGYEYTSGSWEAVPGQQITKLIKLGKIEKIEGSNPSKYRKIKVPSSFRNDGETDRLVKGLKDGQKVLLGTMR